MKRFIAAADIGGTFTDLVLYDSETQTLTFEKLLTTPDDPRRAVMDGLRRMPSRADIVMHGTTLVTNAVIERRGVATGLITTEGYRDVLEIGSELRYDSFDLQIERPEPLVPRTLRVPVRGRLNADGSEAEPLDETAVRAAADVLRRASVQSVAIAFFNAYCNPAHEERAHAILREVWPEATICTSSAVSPEIREYERFSTCAANAYVAPIANRYLTELERSLSAKLFVMLSDGGITTAAAATERPITLVESGPAAGAMGAAFLAQQAGWDDVIAFDMGGTTAKLSLIHHGRPHRTHELEVARLARFKKGSGLPLRLPAIDLIEIGAGGGSIAAADPLGLMQVGPRSAGAVPGPACYAAGGQDPTVTDADLLRGYLSPRRFLGGRMRLDPALAETAIARLAHRLGIGVMAAASGIARVVDNNMATAARVHIAESGTDPHRYTQNPSASGYIARRVGVAAARQTKTHPISFGNRVYQMVAFGGAGPVHAYELARLLGIKHVMFPRGAGVASAIGMLVAPRAVEFSQSRVEHLAHIDWAAVSVILAALKQRGAEVLIEGGVESSVIGYEVSADMRYAGQGFEVSVRLDDAILATHDQALLRAAFDTQYADRYGRSLPGMDVEIVSWRVRAIAPPLVTQIHLAQYQQSSEPLIEYRNAWFAEAGAFLNTPVYARNLLPPGTRINGPALVEEPESTAVIGPAASAEVNEQGHLIMQLEIK